MNDPNDFISLICLLLLMPGTALYWTGARATGIGLNTAVFTGSALAYVMAGDRALAVTSAVVAVLLAITLGLHLAKRRDEQGRNGGAR